MIVTADLDGDSWRIEAPDGSRVVQDAGPPWRLRLVVPGVLAPLSVREVIEAAREGACGLRVVGHSPYGRSDYVVGVEAGEEMPLFDGVQTR